MPRANVQDLLIAIRLFNLQAAAANSPSLVRLSIRLFLHVRVMHTAQTQLAFYVYVMSELLEARISGANTQTQCQKLC